MFETLFQSPEAIARHQAPPYAEERVRYLEHCACSGYTRLSLLFIARELLWVARKLSAYPDLRLNLEQIETVAHDWTERERCCRRTVNPQAARPRFIQTARSWLRFLGCLQEPEEPIPFADLIEEFTQWMERERGLAPKTIRGRREYLRQFLRWYGARKQSFAAVCLEDVEAYLTEGGTRWSRVSVKNAAGALRAFFLYGQARGWCSSSIADAIRGPRLFSQEGLPSGPSWPEVRRLLADVDTDRPEDIRDRAVLMLFAIYGFRASEVSHLRLEDFDWAQDRILLLRAKRRGPQVYPLISAVGNAVARYLHEVRPRCSCREVFLTRLAPLRALSRGALYSLTHKRLLRLGVDLRHRGPHSLRHACAGHLLSKGLSLKEIADHLGHRSLSATRIYAKVDLPHLREVADFDLGGLL